MTSKPLTPKTLYLGSATCCALCLALLIMETVVPIDRVLLMVVMVCCLLGAMVLLGMGTVQGNINRYCDSICIYRGDCENPYHWGLECYLKKE